MQISGMSTRRISLVLYGKILFDIIIRVILIEIAQ